MDKNFEDEDSLPDEASRSLNDGAKSGRRARGRKSDPYGKQRVIASNNGLTVSTVSSPIFETRKLFPLIFP